MRRKFCGAPYARLWLAGLITAGALFVWQLFSLHSLSEGDSARHNHLAVRGLGAEGNTDSRKEASRKFKCRLPIDQTKVGVDFLTIPTPLSQARALEEVARGTRLCPGLSQCKATEQPFLYPVMAHRNRVNSLALYVASLAAVGHGFANTAPIAAMNASVNSPPLQWWPLLTNEPYSADRLQMWARCTCVIVGDFNTTFAPNARSGDHPSTWSLEKHGHIREAVNQQWPGHVAWVNSPEPFSSALANTRAWSAIPTHPERSIVHISVADMLHTSAAIIAYALQVTRPGKTVYLPQTWYSYPAKHRGALGHACVSADPALGRRLRDGTGVVFVSLSDLHASGGYSAGFLKRTEWGGEDGDLVCNLEKTGLQMVRDMRLGFCHLYHERVFDRSASLDGQTLGKSVQL